MNEWHQDHPCGLKGRVSVSFLQHGKDLTGLSEVEGQSFRRSFSIVDAAARTLPSDLRKIWAYVYLFDRKSFNI